MPIETILPLVAAGVNAASQSGLNRANRKWQEKQWDKQNQYNHPVQNRKRLEEAGINPFYTGLQGTAAGSVGSPSTKAAELDIGQYNTARQIQNDTKVTNASIAKLEAETRGIELDNVDKTRANNQTFDTGDGKVWQGPSGLKGSAAVLQMQKTSADTTKSKAETIKIGRALDLIGAQIKNLNAQNLPYKAIQEIVDIIKDITNYDEAKNKAINAIKQKN